MEVKDGKEYGCQLNKINGLGGAAVANPALLNFPSHLVFMMQAPIADCARALPEFQANERAES
ncbi:hypothetical protein [Herbaspirillum sp.]|uniref:hypothetical protein n=1 Tax=Herbaspirillum sp. TaxID=1890675 RepID=UPI0031DD75FF